jgi:hypothetical protein
MKKRELADDITDLRWRVEKLEAVGEQRKESRDAEIANMKTVHEVSSFWRMRAEDLQKKLAAPSVQGERVKELEQQVKLLESQLAYARSVPRPSSDPAEMPHKRARKKR